MIVFYDSGVWTAWPLRPYSFWWCLGHKLFETQVQLNSVLQERLEIVNIQQFMNYKQLNVNHVLYNDRNKYTANESNKHTQQYIQQCDARLTDTEITNFYNTAVHNSPVNFENKWQLTSTAYMAINVNFRVTNFYNKRKYLSQ